MQRLVRRLARLIFMPLILVLATSHLAQAEVVVLIHGYMGSPKSWEQSGVSSALARAGWGRGGVVKTRSGRIKFGPDANAAKVVYSLSLPWMRALAIQADALDEAINLIRRERPNESITLVGHSVGGVVARMWLVRYGAQNIDSLITIASPHLGTSRARDALRVTQPVIYPVDKVRSIFGGKLYNSARRSRALLKDLRPPARNRNSTLNWLNSQPHPNIEYISIVREDAYGLDQDWVVSANSQDMTLVPALRGRATTLAVSSGHSLEYRDGRLLADLLERGSSL